MKYLSERIIAYIALLIAVYELFTKGWTNASVVFFMLSAIGHGIIDLKIHIDDKIKDK